ncbi:M-phase inducer phosphatase [Microdochium trichocladiopsis]|uniref:M-phase inducer phosphatase n=1 Tax=Microdochium trichocladiopsis TaxID=1682393 RepID=A0A9P9BKR6_9PEZI|nr:M-phase inducer phosphatase [Microdochium trichocladiopsis]KAH7027307.1 M-phase inducer phosphatase [Microdochium trichocladiopsis]
MMEASSPLAAMHPAPPPSWGQHNHGFMSTGNPFAAVPLQLQRTKADYFNLKSVRGSSPTASLAADLCQNFRIDNESSPKFPTPRRALFTSNPLDHAHTITTPPLPATSSPVPMNESMDISPLPARAPFCTTIEVTSPTPLTTPIVETPSDLQSPEDESMMMDSPTAMLRQPAANLEVPRTYLEPRKRAALRRPSLTRTKGHSTSSLITRVHSESQFSSFNFGPEMKFGSTSSALSASECFQESPPNERRPQSANSPTPSGLGMFRPKPQFASLTGTRERTGSPLGCHARRPSNPFNRPRRQYRRSLSMFEHPADVVKARPEELPSCSALQAVMDIEDAEEPILPSFVPEDQSGSLPRITRETFLDLLDGKYSDKYDQKVVIDCRFEYEYEGGHIDGAINYTDKELLTKHLFDTPMPGKTVLVFHCEYSAHRAPMMARHIRSEDRSANAEFYPRLSYPEVYILDGGYSEFFNEHRDRCYPQAYVEMGAEEHAFTCERELGKLQQKRKGLGRAKTFAFGQRESMVDASPTAPGRAQSYMSPSLMCGNSPILGTDRSPRRLASY